MDEYTLNCWEVKDCGREPSGRNVSLHGVCPVATETKVDGIHNGKNGGRCCWAVVPVNNPGYCSAGIIGCLTCDFYNMVRRSTELVVGV